MEGEDAWKVAQQTMPVILRGDGKDVKKFKFKTQVLMQNSTTPEGAWPAQETRV